MNLILPKGSIIPTPIQEKEFKQSGVGKGSKKSGSYIYRLEWLLCRMNNEQGQPRHNYAQRTVINRLNTSKNDFLKFNS